jgi:hypothetical protein
MLATEVFLLSPSFLFNLLVSSTLETEQPQACFGAVECVFASVVVRVPSSCHHFNWHQFEFFAYVILPLRQ